MHDLRRLLKYLTPHWPIFLVATFAMLIVGLLESAIGGLIVPIFDQAFVQGSGHRTATLFGLQRLIPESPLGAWKTISLLLLVFTLAKGVAEYFSTYLMLASASRQYLNFDRTFIAICWPNPPASLSAIAPTISCRGWSPAQPRLKSRSRARFVTCSEKALP